MRKVSNDLPRAGSTLTLGPVGSVAHPLKTASSMNGASLRMYFMLTSKIVLNICCHR